MRVLLKIVYKKTRVLAFLISLNSNMSFEVLMRINIDCCLLGYDAVLSGERLPNISEEHAAIFRVILEP
jgi:hypothetical protein